MTIDTGQGDEFENSRPRLRSQIRFFPQQQNGTSTVVVEDLIRSRFFQIGPEEYRFASLLDGQRTVKQIIAEANQERPAQGSTCDLPETTVCDRQRASAIIATLTQLNLLQVNDGQILARQSAAREKSQMVARFNPVFQKLTLPHPQKFFRRLKNVFDPLFSVPFLMAWLVLIGWGGISIYENWSEFSVAARGILSGGRWIWMLAIWIGLKIVHEAGHAAACYRFGGSVRENGIAFICFFPIAFVDVSDSWRFANRWHRMTVCFAGMYFELFIAAVAAILWCHVGDSVFRDALYNIVIIASVTTLLFNANPLMKFDGYYLLSDLVQRPTLYQQSQSAIGNLLKWFFFGTPRQQDRGTFLLVYGIAAFAWRVVIFIGLFIAMSLLGDGIGILFAFVSVLYLFVPPGLRLIRRLRSAPINVFGWKRFGFACGALFLLFATCFVLVFRPARIVAPGIVELIEPQVVRSKVDGFIRELHVDDGTWVRQGDVVAILENPELRRDLANLRLEQQQKELAVEQLRADGDTGQVNAESQMVAKLKADVQHFEDQVSALVIRAQQSGRVYLRNPDHLLGTFLETGSELMWIGDPDRKSIVAAIPQHQAADLSPNQIGNRASSNSHRVQGHFYTGETGLATGALATVCPKASTSLPNLMLGANLGGPLPVKLRNQEASSGSEYELVEPHLFATFELPTPESRRLAFGRHVNVIVPGKRSSLGYQLYKSARRWIAQKYKFAVASTDRSL